MTAEDIKKIRVMIGFLVKHKISERLKHLSDIEGKIYELTGINNQAEIVKSLKTAPNTVSNTWKKLESEGLLIKDGKSYKKVV